MAPTVERRHIERHRTLLGGVLVHGPGCLTVDCRVRDLSDAGAQLKTISAVLVQAPTGLLIPSLHRASLVAVDWQRGPSLGLHFRQEVDVRAPTTEEPERTMQRIAQGRG